jgi:uncharacterized protein (TIGR03083 family)
MKPVEPIQTVELFPELSVELLRLLKSLPAADWNAATACVGWTVKDVTAHLLGGNMSRLSFGRDRLTPLNTSGSPMGYSDLVDFINRRNAEWVNACRLISPPLLIQLIELTDPQVYEYFKSLLPSEKAGIPVSWAGETQSAWWFDIAREYTEKWLHQQHIREALGKPVLTDRQWLFPVLDTFLRALPYGYRNVDAPDGTAIAVQITGNAGGEWALLRQNYEWQLLAGECTAATASVRIDQDTAWRLFTKGISPTAAQARIQFTGDLALGMRILDVVSIMA